MKQVLFISIAMGLVLVTGCTKENEDGSTELMSATEVAEKTEEVAVQVADKTQETLVQVAEKTEEVTQKVEAITTTTTEAISSLSVKTEEVMADLNQSIEQVKEKVSRFDKTQLLSYANTYKDVILEKKDQLLGLNEQLKGLSMTEILGEKGKALKSQLSEYTDQLNGLKGRYSIYLEKLKTFGVDLSAYGL